MAQGRDVRNTALDLTCILTFPLAVQLGKKCWSQIDINTQFSVKVSTALRIGISSTDQKKNGKNPPIKLEFIKLDMSVLVPHEGVFEEHIREVTDEMRADGFQLRPIAISRLDSLGPKWRNKFMIHDGHHRLAALKRLECTKIMGSIFDFYSPRIKVFRVLRDLGTSAKRGSDTESNLRNGSYPEIRQTLHRCRWKAESLSMTTIYLSQRCQLCFRN